MSDVVLRKKKNADAQAAFRARRANYIATLEETGLSPHHSLPHRAHIRTVTTLESVVIQLQESCRESRQEAADLRTENNRLREREKQWQTFVHARKTGTDDLPPPPLSSPFLGHVQSNALSPTILGPHAYPNGLAYRGDSVVCQTPYPSSSSAGSSFTNQSPSVPFEDGASGPTVHRSGRYAPYTYPMHGANRGHRYGLSNSDSLSSSQSQSPSYVASPSLTSTDMSAYSGRFSGGEEQKAALNSVLDSAPYVFPSNDRFHQTIGDSVPNSRSISPMTTSTPNSSTSMSLTSSFPYTFPESSTGHDRSDFDYRRHSLPHCPEVTLHGGTADITLTGQAPDVLRYGMRRRTDTAADHQQILSPNENGSQGSSDGDQPSNGTRPEPRRHTISSHSGSPSPGPAPISCTVAVIKAQAFGALRRTRAKTKKTSEGAARVTKGVLESRGIGIDGSSLEAQPNRPLLENEYDNKGAL